MPYATNKGVRLYWEEHGKGDPILLIMGLSFTLDMWFRLAPVLARDYRVILFDNRGVGRSDVPRGPYSIGVMAEDAMAILTAAGVQEPVCVLGASMGGMIAQEIALRYPDRFRALLLACTACGPLFRASLPNFKRSPGFWNWYRLKGEAREQALVRMLYSDLTPPERIEEDLRVRAVRQPGIGAIINQLAGIVSWSSYRRLPQLNLPALVAHGDQDHILPAANGVMIARRIPNAEFVLLPDCGHMIMTDQPQLSLQVIEGFLARVTAGFPISTDGH